MLSSIIIFLLLSLAIILIFSQFNNIDWLVHRSMTKNNCYIWIKCNYDDFINNFDNQPWVIDPSFKSSLFANYPSSAIHASIIKINNVGFVFKTPWDYYKAMKVVKNKIESINAAKAKLYII